METKSRSASSRRPKSRDDSATDIPERPIGNGKCAACQSLSEYSPLPLGEGSGVRAVYNILWFQSGFRIGSQTRSSQTSSPLLSGMPVPWVFESISRQDLSP
jgi:hypothetical protein